MGAELSRQVAAYHPARLVLLDHHEQRLVSTVQSLGRPADRGWDDAVLADVRDLATLTAVMLHVHPDVVFHAASLNDHVLLERQPREALLTNVIGTRNMLQAATQAGAGTFVTVTRPGPTGPSTVLSRSQSEAERLTTCYAHNNLGRYVAVRLTDRAVTSLPAQERARLVLAAAAQGTDGGVVDAARRSTVVA